MSLDPQRAALVVKEYRYATQPSAAASAAIKARYVNARVLEYETNLDAAGGDALAADIASMTAVYVRSVTFEMDGVLYPEDLMGGMPRFVLNFPRHVSLGSNPYTVVSIKPDYFNNVTTMTVRGS